MRLRGQAEFADLGLSTSGRFAVYGEERNAGFLTLGYNPTADETLSTIVSPAHTYERDSTCDLSTLF